MPNLDSVYNGFQRARNAMIGSAQTPREQLADVSFTLGSLHPRVYPPQLRKKVEKWVTTWFQVEALEDFHEGAPLMERVDNDDARQAIDELTDKMWADVKRDYRRANPLEGDTRYDW